MRQHSRRAALVALLSAVPGLVSAQAPLKKTETDVPRITLDALKAEMAKGNVVVLDVRSKAAYDSGHIPGAVLASDALLEQKVPELKKTKKLIVTYCT